MNVGFDNLTQGFYTPQGTPIDEFVDSHKDGRNLRLKESFDYISKDGIKYHFCGDDELGKGNGWWTDGASTPPALWEKLDIPWIPPFGWYHPGARCHDYLYRYTQFSKDLCDGILYEIMLWLIGQMNLNVIEKEEHELKAKLIFEGVHLAGWASFSGDRKAPKKEANKDGIK